MSFIEHYETQLVEAGRRRRDARWRNRLARWLRTPRRRGAAVVLAALLVGVPATAATVGWNPFDDPGRDPRLPPPTVSERPPVRELTSILGVLRRPQTDADRGPATEAALRRVDDAAVDGVALDHVRLLDERRGIVLVPAERFGPGTDRGRPPAGPAPSPSPPGSFRNAACLYVPDGDGGAGLSCSTAARIRSGHAILSGGGRAVGLVPDGVARVRFSRGPVVVEVPVRDNLFVYQGRYPEVAEWLAADGTVIERIDLRRG